MTIFAASDSRRKTSVLTWILHTHGWNDRGGGGVGKGEAIHFYGGGIKALCVRSSSSRFSICLSAYHSGLAYP